MARLRCLGRRTRKVVQWLAQVKAAGVPVLFAGVLPFGREDALAELRDVFGSKGTANQMDGPLRDLALVLTRL